MNDKKVAIIGAGLAGLNCARLLENDFEITLFDKNSQVGGRILSDQVEGYTLDHGFQVFLPDYPEAKLAFNYEALDLQSFTPGALIRINKDFYKFSDPLRQPQDMLATLLAPIGNFKDKLLILKLKNAVKKPNPNLKNISTYEYLKYFGFSQDIIERFFKPFFSGVFLERELKTSAYFFSFLFSLFSKCNATIPKKGMIELPLNLANQLRKTNILLNTEVTNITNSSISVNGLKEEFDYIITAFDDSSVEFQTVTTDYFYTDHPIATKPTLYLNGNPQGVINHIAPMSSVNPAYSPKDKFLWSVNLLSPNHNTEIKEVKRELESWFEGENFIHLKRFTIDKALPAQPFFGKSEILADGIYKCGDQMQDPSINGALKSGRLVAEVILSKK